MELDDLADEPPKQKDLSEAVMEAESIIHRLCNLILEVKGKAIVSSNKESVWQAFMTNYRSSFKRLRRNAWYKSLIPKGEEPFYARPKLLKFDKSNTSFRLPFIKLALDCFPNDLASEHNTNFWTLVSIVFSNHFENKYREDEFSIALGNDMLLFCTKIKQFYIAFELQFDHLSSKFIAVSEEWLEFVEEHQQFCNLSMPSIFKILKQYTNPNAQTSMTASETKSLFIRLENQRKSFIERTEKAPYMMVIKGQEKSINVVPTAKEKKVPTPTKEEVFELDPDFEVQQTQEVDTFATLYGEEEEEEPLQTPQSMPPLYKSPKK